MKHWINDMKIKKAVIPVAGKGTRFLPATKQIPKEMIPLVDRPMIHYAVEEAVKAGIEQIIFVISSGKECIENYFDRNMELEAFLKENEKTDLLKMIKEVGTMINVCSVRQKEQLGLGHAVNCAREVIGNEPFAVILGDDLVISDIPVTKQLIDIFEREGEKSVIGVMEVPIEETSKYGIVKGNFLKNDDKTMLMKTMVEKPLPSVAPSNLATPGRYILTPQIFDCLDKIERGAGGEYQLTDAINMLAEKEKVYAHIFNGDRFDTGSIEGYLRAVLEFAINDPTKKELMTKIIKEVTLKYNL